MKLFTCNLGGVLGSTMAIIVAANIAGAKPNDTAYETSAASFRGIEFAQANTNSLSASDLRRLVFYTNRALDALAALAEEDALASTGAAISGNSVDVLRDAITRLIDAGTRSGLSQNDVADYFYLAAEERFQQNIPLALQDASGNIDTRSLFTGVIGRSNPAEEPSVDLDYLALLNQESEGLDLGINSPAAEVQIVEVVEETSGPQLREGADAATRAIVGRVIVENDVWKIQVVSGDTLATFASAIYGDSLAYRQIFNANSSVLANANALVVGQVLVIPKP